MRKLTKKNVTVFVLTVSSIVNIGLVALLMSSFNLMSFLAYAALAFVLGSLIKFKKGDYQKYFLLGVGLSVLYNASFSAIGFFSITFASLAFAAIQQGLITMIIYEITGGKL